MPRVGVLALQGDVREHTSMLERVGADVVAVRSADQLDDLDGLVMPGGESTTIAYLLDDVGHAPDAGEEDRRRTAACWAPAPG